MNALHLATEAPETRGRPSVTLNMIEGSAMFNEYVEVRAKKSALIAQIHVLNTIESDLRLFLQIAGKL